MNIEDKKTYTKKDFVKKQSWSQNVLTHSEYPFFRSDVIVASHTLFCSVEHYIPPMRLALLQRRKKVGD